MDKMNILMYLKKVSVAWLTKMLYNYAKVPKQKEKKQY